jgi:PiT family inorganic phosphate transporter
MSLSLIIVVIVIALVFEYINGFHDTANSIATVVGTKVLTPRQAILLAAVTNLAGALMGSAVAKTITSGIVDNAMIAAVLSQHMLICALLGAIVWNLFTWWFGMPSSSSHALVGGLCGAALGVVNGDWNVIKWVETKTKLVTQALPAPAEFLNQLGAQTLHAGTNSVVLGTNHVTLIVSQNETLLVTSRLAVEKSGILYKVVIPMISSPAAGLVCGFLFMGLLYFLLRNWRPSRVNRTFGWLQLGSAGYMGLMHGLNDAQKTMGIITLGLIGATSAGAFDGLPHWLGFLKTSETMPAVWVKVVCSLTMASGTAAGGWRIIRTLGHRMVRLQPVHGFAAEATAATVLAVTGIMGMPVSTTHAISTTIMGVGCAKRFNALKYTVVERILWAWLLTLPASALMGYLLVRLGRAIGWIPTG